tara:strand:- start:3777 stop:4955 length:1179 start_codon:yes stop_codon:yes gene_type:complete
MTVIRKSDLGFSFEQPEGWRNFPFAHQFAPLEGGANFFHGMVLDAENQNGANMRFLHSSGNEMERHIDAVGDFWGSENLGNSETEVTLGSHRFLKLTFEPWEGPGLPCRYHYFLQRDGECFILVCQSSSADFERALDGVAASIDFFESPREGRLSELALFHYAPSAKRALSLAAGTAAVNGDDTLTPGHLYAGLVLSGDTTATNMLARYGITAAGLGLEVPDKQAQETDVQIDRLIYDLLTERVFSYTKNNIRSVHLLLGLLGTAPFEAMAGRIDPHKFRYGVIHNLQQEEDINLLFCDFCGASQNEVKKLIAGPNSYICNECVSKAESELAAGIRIRGSVHCCFCGRHAEEVERKMLSSWVSDEDDARRVCHECIALCREIVDEEQQSSEQ